MELFGYLVEHGEDVLFAFQLDDLAVGAGALELLDAEPGLEHVQVVEDLG